MIPSIFDGATVTIVAGGPSLKGFDFARLKGRPTIAINRAFEVVEKPDILWWSDWEFWLKNSAAIKAHGAAWKVTGERNANDLARYQILGAPEIEVLLFTGLDGYDEKAGCIRHGNNSGYAAIHLAAKLGAAKIVVLGLDMKHGPGDSTHWHGGYAVRRQERTLTHMMAPYFPSLADALTARGIKVVNGCQDSTVTCWPRVSIDEALA